MKAAQVLDADAFERLHAPDRAAPEGMVGEECVKEGLFGDLVGVVAGLENLVDGALDLAIELAGVEAWAAQGVDDELEAFVERATGELRIDGQVVEAGPRTEEPAEGVESLGPLGGVARSRSASQHARGQRGEPR